MSEVATFRLRGLDLSTNEHTAVQGALIEADNIVISKDDVIEPRRGFERLGNPLITSVFYRAAQYRDALIAHDGSEAWISSDSGATWSNYGGATPGTFRSAEANGNLYFTSDAGVMRQSSVTSLSVQPAGIPPALTMVAGVTTGGGVLPATKSVGYRLVWGKRDANGNLLLGAPSPRAVVTNTDAVNDHPPLITIPVPPGTQADFFWQLYRTDVADTADDVGDEMYLVHEASVGAATGSFNYTDIAVMDRRGAALYSNETQRGAIASQFPPPKAGEIAAFGGSLFFANVEDKASAKLWMKALPTAGDTVTVNGIVYTADATTTDVSARTFLVDTIGATDEDDIALTLGHLAYVLNLGDSGVTAQDISTEGGTPGHLLVTARSFGDTVTLAASGVVEIDPNPVLAGTNELRWSAPLQPDAVPLLNTARVGSADKEILRLAPTKESLWIFKEDGLFRLTGVNGQWAIDPFDPTVRLVAEETVAILGNAVWCLTDQGVMRITESGAQVISRPIEPALAPLLAPYMRATTQAKAFAVAFEAEHKYFLWLPGQPGDASATHAYVFDAFSETWVHRTDGALTALVTNDSRFYKFTSSGVYRELRGFDDDDYTDNGAAIAYAVKWPVVGPPGSLKHWQDLVLHFKTALAISATLTFETEAGNAEVVAAYYEHDTALPAMLPLFLGQETRANLRALVPLETSRSSVLQIGLEGETSQGFELQGVTLRFNPGSGRVST